MLKRYNLGYISIEALASSVDKWSYLKNAFSEGVADDHALPSSIRELSQALYQTVSEENILTITKALSLLIEA